MPNSQSQRPKFYQNQYLGAEDLTNAVEYSRIQDARHALGAHTWGIAMGLQLKERELPNGQVEVFIQPGYAWDGFGRPIVVLESNRIPEENFKSFVYNALIDGGSPEGRLIEVWLRYDETTTQMPRPGFEVCDPEDQFSRIQETFLIEVGRRPNHSDQHASITVAGRSVDAQKAFEVFDPSDPLIEDESVPYQTFPETGESRRWLIPLGYVRWKPNPDATQPGNFVNRTVDDLEQSRRLRRYVGVVAEAIQAANGHVRLKSRTIAPSLVWSDDLVWVEGHLRVEGDSRLFGGKLDFRDANGADQDVPLWIQRTEDNGLGGKDLRIRIGQNENGDHRLAVGPQVGTDFHARLVVRDDGNVGIGAARPEHKLQIGDASGPVSLSLRGPDGDTVSSTLAFEDDGGTGLRWFKVTHDTSGNKLKIISAEKDPIMTFSRTTGNVGIGTDSPQNSLHVAQQSHLNAIFDRTDTSDHLTLTVGSAGSGIHFGDSNRFFISADPYAQRNTTGFGKEVFTILPSGNVGIGATNPAQLLTLGGQEGTRLEIARTSASFPWVQPSGAINPGSFVINQQSQGSSHPEADFALMRDRKKRVILGDVDTFLSSQDGGNIRFFVNREEPGEQEIMRVTGSGRVGIGTTNTNPVATLDVAGSFRLNQGTIFSKIQSGTAAVGSSTTRRKNFAVSFPQSFTGNPKIIALTRGGSFPDTFAVTTNSISPTGFSVNVLRLDATSGWGQNLGLDWIAWE